MVMDETVQGRTKKFDILLCHGQLSFCKHPALHEVEERHGVDLGFAYKTDVKTQKPRKVCFNLFIAGHR